MGFDVDRRLWQRIWVEVVCFDVFIVFSDGFVWVRMGLLFWICGG